MRIPLRFAFNPGAKRKGRGLRSEGEEGKFFLWELGELEELLGVDSWAVAKYYDVTARGNFEGKNILHVERDLEEAAAKAEISPDFLAEVLERAKPTLFAAREQRIKPARDDKALAEWNGMMLKAFAYAAGVFAREDYRRIAERNGEFLLREMVVEEGAEGQRGRGAGVQRNRGAEGQRIRGAEDQRGRGAAGTQHFLSDFTIHHSPFTIFRLFRSWSPASLTGGAPQAKLNAYLEDYANVIDGLLELYQLTFELNWLQAARDLAETMLALFWDERHGGFFQTSVDHEALIARPKDFVDNAVPAGNSVVAKHPGVGGRRLAQAVRLPTPLRCGVLRNRRRALRGARRDDPAPDARGHGQAAAGRLW